MKKLFYLFTLLCVMFVGFTSCNSCSNEKADNATKDSIEMVVNNDSALVVENVLGLDKQYMFINYGKDYRWYETCIVLKDFLDEENDGTITGVSNIFQVVFEKDNGADVNVIMFTHVGDSTQMDIKQGFWVEDMPMNEDAIKVTFKEAYDKVMTVNLPKPHSRHVVLRKEVGPNQINPQYIFGNAQAQIYVDAVTGNVTDKNPAFPADLKMPLGEWP